MNNLHRNMQTLLLLATFLPVTLSALYGADIVTSHKTILGWGVIVAILIINYLILEIWGKKFSEKLLRWVNYSILANIAAFVPILLIIGMTHQTNTIIWPYTWVFELSLWATFALPIITLIFLSIFPTLSTIYSDHQQSKTDGTYRRICEAIKKKVRL